MKTITRLMMVLGIALLVGACGPDDENNGNNGGNNGADAGDVSMDTEGDTEGDTEVDGDADTTTEQSIVASDQTADPANEVTVDEVISDGPGWIVIHEENSTEDGPGAVIGNASVSDGTSTDVGVTLDRDAVDGETLYAMLHEDSPEDGNYTFDPADAEPEDPPATDSNGEVVVDPFTVSLAGANEPSVTVSDQTPAPANEVVVDEVVSEGAGWIVIHEENEAGDSFGAVIGNSAVENGTNTDVSVTLDRDVTDGETLYAMLHEDNPADGSYTFDAADADPEDPPVMSGGGPVVETFVVSQPGDEPTVTATDQTLELTTMVTVASANLLADGFIVIHEQNEAGDAAGAVIGHTAVSAGSVNSVDVGLDRPVEDSEVLYAMLHEDTGNAGEYEFDGTSGSPDQPVIDSNDDVVVNSFEVEVPADTPAVRFSVSNNGLASYDITAATPQRYEAWIGSESANQTLTLNVGWRYEIENNAGLSAHPFELINAGAAGVGDTVLASQQSAVNGSMEGDPDVNWVQNSDTVTFTLTTNLDAELNGYRCGSHPNTMRGTVTTQSP